MAVGGRDFEFCRRRPELSGQGARRTGEHRNRRTGYDLRPRGTAARVAASRAGQVPGHQTARFPRGRHPGAGKTTFALRVAAELLADRTVEQITVVVPTEHLKHQWAAAARGSGIALDPKFSNSTGQTSSDYHGVVVTYAQVATHPFLHRVRTESRRTLVILDEIHHGGDAKSWGEAIREAFERRDPPARADRYPVPQRRQRHPVRRPTSRTRTACAVAGRPLLRLRRRARRRRRAAGGVPRLLG